MPIEIKELHVKLHIDDEESVTSQANEKDSTRSSETTNQEMLLDNTVKEVLRILKEQNER